MERVKQHFEEGALKETFEVRPVASGGRSRASVPELVVASVIRKVRDCADHDDGNRRAKKEYRQQ